MSSRKLPTSPHLQIYRLPLTALLSITHRITGVILSFGILLLVWILAAAAFDPAYYNAMVPHLGSWYGQVFVFGLITLDPPSILLTGFLAYAVSGPVMLVVRRKRRRA